MGWLSDVVDIGLDVAGEVLGGGGDGGGSGGGAAPFMQRPDPILNELLDTPKRQEQGVAKAKTTPLPSGRLGSADQVQDTEKKISEAQDIATTGWEQTEEWFNFLLSRRNQD